jgi:hypothetical protein
MFTGRMWRRVASAMAIGLGLLASDIAQAAPGSAVCRSIEAQLARGGGTSTNRRYGAAAERQRREIGKIRGQMAAAGCGFFNSSPRCARLSRMAARMNSNLGQLSAKSGSGRSRGQLLAALNANNCRATRKNVVVASRENGPGIMDRLFGDQSRDRAPRMTPDSRAIGTPLAFWRSDEPRRQSGGRDRIVRDRASGSVLPSGSYRTFCVRTCDGYYFPMSPSSTREDMERDEKNCQAACPGAETALYFHADDVEDAEAMISRANGKTYEKLKTAFVYRDASTLKAPQCTCGQSGGLQLASAAFDKGEKKKPMLLPINRPDPMADPETLANAEGGLSAEAISTLLSEGRELDIAQRQVRVVGPVFLPDPEGAKVRPVPGQTATR